MEIPKSKVEDFKLKNSNDTLIETLKRLGISDINYNIKVESGIFRKYISDEDYNFNLANEIYYFEDSSKGFVFKSLINENEEIVFKFEKKDFISVFYQQIEKIDDKTYYLRYFDKSYRLLKEYLIVNGQIIDSFDAKATEADCNKLGPAREDESFFDCFERNWSNFGCDFLGLTIQITYPKLVATACAIECGITFK